MVKKFSSYGALDAFIMASSALLVKCWPDTNGNWVAEFKL
jgi:hypothetical protein